MKLNRRYRLTDSIESFAKLSAAEDAEARIIARAMTAMPYNTMAAIRQALAHDIIRLDQAIEWANGESEEQRAAQFRTAVITYFAVNMAMARL